MAKSFESHTKNIGSILGNFETRIVQVPKFQRGFSWEKGHVNAFWTDVIAFLGQYVKAPSATYFFGPIVVEETPEKIILLDGQQRLATSTILLAAVRDAARTLVFVKGTPGADFARDVQKALVIKEDEEDASVEYSLRLGDLDRDYFRKTVQEDPPSQLTPKLKSHSLIDSASKILRTEVNNQIAGLPSDDALKTLKRIRDCLVKGFTVVSIHVKNEDDAYSIFETLNDRGLRLSVPDLLLNLLMRRGANDAERRAVRLKWNYMLKELGRRDISRFLRHMWLSRYGDLKARGLFNELKDHLTEKKLSSLDFVEACVVDCDSYISLLDQTTLPADAANDVAGLIKYLGITSSLPLLLAGLQTLSESDFTQLARNLVSLGVRYSLIGDLNPNTLENAFYAAAREVRRLKSLKPPKSSAQCLRETRSILSPLNPTNRLVEEKAMDVTIDRGPALWLMTELANSKQSKTREVSVTNANLEHIFPQNADVAAWPNKDDLIEYVWRLGNLTILSTKLNTKADRKAFSVKVTNYYKKSEIKITKQIGKYPQWTPSEVERRTKEMAKLVVQVFP
jgi:hypothetical protein